MSGMDPDEERVASRIAGRLLGAVLKQPPLMRLLVAARLKPIDIASSNLRTLWSVMAQQWTATGTINPALARESLEALLAHTVANPTTAANETIAYCMRAQAVDLATDLPGLLEHMRQRVALRELRRMAEGLAVDVDRQGANPLDLIDRLKKSMDALLVGSASIRSADGAELAAITHTMLTQGRGDRTYVPLGFAAVDAMLGGGAPVGEPIVIGAGTGVGKSTFATHVGLHMLEQGRRVLWFSFEAERDRVAMLLAQMKAGWLFPLRPEDATREQSAALADATAWLAEQPLHVEDFSGLTVEQVRASVAMHVQIFGVDSVLIDYAQDIDKSREHATQRGDEPYVHISRELRKTAKDERVAMVQFSQVRELDKGERRLQAHHTAFSKQFSRDAAAVVMLERDAMSKDVHLRDVTRVGVVKNRHGGKAGDAWVRYDHRTGRLMPCTEHGDPMPTHTTQTIRQGYVGTDMDEVAGMWGDDA